MALAAVGIAAFVGKSLSSFRRGIWPNSALKYRNRRRSSRMTSQEILIRLIRTRDRETLGCVDNCPPETAWIDFVGPPEVVQLDGGKFFPEYDQIDLYRHGAAPHPQGSPLEAAARSPRPTEELVSLAHELGHLDSKLRGNVFPPTDSEHAYAEELRAWHFAEGLLRENDFEEWDAFRALRGQGLASYRDNLALSDSQLETAALLVAADQRA